MPPLNDSLHFKLLSRFHPAVKGGAFTLLVTPSLFTRPGSRVISAPPHRLLHTRGWTMDSNLLVDFLVDPYTESHILPPMTAFEEPDPPRPEFEEQDPPSPVPESSEGQRRQLSTQPDKSAAAKRQPGIPLAQHVYAVAMITSLIVGFSLVSFTLRNGFLQAGCTVRDGAGLSAHDGGIVDGLADGIVDGIVGGLVEAQERWERFLPQLGVRLRFFPARFEVYKRSEN